MRRTNANCSSSGPNWFTGVTKTKTCAVSWCLQLHYTNMKYLPTSWVIYCKTQHVRTVQETLQWKVNLFISILPYKFAFSLERGTIITFENIFNMSLSSVSWAYSMNEILILFWRPQNSMKAVHVSNLLPAFPSWFPCSIHVAFQCNLSVFIALHCNNQLKSP